MRETILIIFILYVCTAKVSYAKVSSKLRHLTKRSFTLEPTNDTDCWLRLNAPQLFENLEQLDSDYATTQEAIQQHLDENGFNETMIQGTCTNYRWQHEIDKRDAMRTIEETHQNFHYAINNEIVAKRGAAYREIAKSVINNVKIPAGMNLGGMCMMRLEDSILFFYRMKLRNDTHFRITVLHNGIKDMVLRAHLSLNDVHLQGAYERTMTDEDPSALIYVPSFGELQLLLKNVQYEVEGRYRLIKGRLVIELIVSQLIPEDIILTYFKTPYKPAIKLQKDNLGDFLSRMKNDLNKWLKDYFNDYLIFRNLDDWPSIKKLEQYDKMKAVHLATFTDNAIVIITKKILNTEGRALKIPRFSITAAHGLKIRIYDGEIRGLDTMYRRSVATTTSKRDNLRYVDTIIGFSDLKVVYKYEINFISGVNAPLGVTGIMILSSNDLTGHLNLGLLRDPEVVEIDLNILEPLGPESLMIKGPANVLISNFKQLLRHQIVTIMSNTLTYGTKLLRSLPRCEHIVPGQVKMKINH